MSVDFGWWNKDAERGKYQVVAKVHGGNLLWQSKQGHHSTWEPHVPSEDDWDRLLFEAGKRVPRRLLSPKQFEVIRALRDRRG